MKYSQNYDGPMLWVTRQDNGSRDVWGGIFFFRVGLNEVHEDHLDVWIKIKFQLGDLSRPFGLVFSTNAFMSIYEKYENFPIQYPFLNIFKTKSYKGQGCISCGTCSYPKLTEDHVLTSAYEPSREMP